jgi:hypothetical protein
MSQLDFDQSTHPHDFHDAILISSIFWAAVAPDWPHLSPEPPSGSDIGAFAENSTLQTEGILDLCKTQPSGMADASIHAVKK